MSVVIHPSSVVSPEAELGNDVVIGPFCVVEGNARIGAGTRLRSHVVIGEHTTIGEGNDIFPHACIGLAPQDLKYHGEPTRLQVGDRNVIRESCTFNRGTVGGGGLTAIGSGNLFMVGSHIGHDCQIGDQNIFANNATLAGHVDVGMGCTVGAFSAVHQFCRVGDHAFMGGFTVATMDVLPYMKTVGARDTKSYGVNTIGLRRKGFAEESVDALAKAHRILFHMNLLREDALNRVEQELGHVAEVAYLARFIREAKRGIHRG